MAASKGVTVGDIMTAPVRSLNADGSLREAAQLLLENGFSGAPVVDHEEKVIGVLSLQDIARYAEWHLDAEEASAGIERERDELRELDRRERGLRSSMHVDRLEDATVRQVMTSRVASVRAGTSLAEATSLLLKGPVHRIFVTNSKGKLVGLVSTMDIVRHFHESLKNL